jgi:hypothetical protein
MFVAHQSTDYRSHQLSSSWGYTMAIGVRITGEAEVGSGGWSTRKSSVCGNRRSADPFGLCSISHRTPRQCGPPWLYALLISLAQN